jgi:hypothetical protein
MVALFASGPSDAVVLSDGRPQFFYAGTDCLFVEEDLGNPVLKHIAVQPNLPFL